MNFIQIFQTQSFRNFVENIIEAEYNMKIYHADMNLTFQYIYTKAIHSSQEIDTCLTCFKLYKYIFSYSIKQNKERPRNTPLTFHYITLKKYLLMLENVNFNEKKNQHNGVDFIITVYILEIDTETLYMYIYNVDISLQSPLWGKRGKHSTNIALCCCHVTVTFLHCPVSSTSLQ